MVIWLFAGGGATEIRGLVPFLEKHYPGYRVHRMTPITRKPGPRPGFTLPGHGRTGESLASEIRERLPDVLARNEECDVILVIDDLDCRSETDHRDRFLDAIDSAHGASAITRFVGFAAPELEVWIIADWANSVAKHQDFRGRHNRMRHWLVTEKNISFETPESYGIYNPDKDSCNEKLSDAIIESTMLHVDDRLLPRYSKGLHTPILLQMIDPEIVKDKCQIFKKLHVFLNENCRAPQELS